MPSKEQTDTHFDIAMVLLSAPDPLCYKLNISIFDQISGGTQSYLKHTKCSYSLHQLIVSKRCLIKTKNENVNQA